MSTLKQIVERRLADLKLGPIEAAVQAGLERTFIRDIVEGRKKSIRADKLAALAHALQLEADALGRNELIPAAGLPSSTKRAVLSSFDPDAPETSDPDWEAGDKMAAYFNGALHYNGTVRGASPEIPAAAGAGQGHVLEDRGVAVKSGGIATGHPVLNEWVIPPDFVRHGLNATPSQIVLIPVVGHSMEPRLYAGDRVLVDLSQSAYAGDAIYVIDDGDEVLKVKTLAKIAGSAPPRFRIISEAAPDRFDELSHDQFRIIGRAVGRFSRM